MCLQAYYSTEDDLAKQIKEWAEKQKKAGIIYCPYCSFSIHINNTECEHCGAPLPAEDHKAW